MALEDVSGSAAPDQVGILELLETFYCLVLILFGCFFSF